MVKRKSLNVTITSDYMKIGEIIKRMKKEFSEYETQIEIIELFSGTYSIEIWKL